MEQKEKIVNSYKHLCDTNNELIEAQKLRIEELEIENKLQKEATESLLVLLDDAIAIAKKNIQTTHPHHVKNEMIIVKDWIKITETSVRLENVLKYGISCRKLKLEELLNMPLDLVQKKDILSFRNAGKKTWTEFEELRTKSLEKKIKNFQ